MGDAGERGGAGKRGIKGEKWDNCYSIIDKIYLKEKKRTHGQSQRGVGLSVGGGDG